MDISICILTHSQPELLPQCVARCLAEIERSGSAGEVILIDNASTDGSPQAVAARFPEVRLLRNEENLSFSAANNKGIRASRGHCVLILNDDALLRPGSLSLMLREVESDPGIGAVGPKLVNPDGSLQRDFTNRRFPHLLNCLAAAFLLDARLNSYEWGSRIFGLNRDLEHTGQAEHLAGACLLVRREALEAVGLFDEQFRFWFEDVDLCYGLRKAGWKIIYLSEAQVTHFGSATIGRTEEAQRAIIFFRSQMCFLKKHWTGPKYLFVRLLSAFAFLLQVCLVLLKVRSPGLNRQERRLWINIYLPVVRLLLLEWN
jgi:GT2 family glycosyltransferase